MAVVRSRRTLVVIFLTLVVAAVFTTTLLPKWRSWERTHQQPRSMLKHEDAASKEIEKQVGVGAMWRTRERQTAAKTIAPPSVVIYNLSKQQKKPRQIAETRDNGAERNGTKDAISVGKMKRRRWMTENQTRAGIRDDEIKRLVEEVLRDKKHENLVDVRSRIEKLPNSSAYKVLQDLLNQVDAQPHRAKSEVQATGIKPQVMDRTNELMRQADREIDSESRPDYRQRKLGNLRDKHPLRPGEINRSRDANVGSESIPINTAKTPPVAKSMMTHITTATPVINTSSHGLDLPFIKRGGIEIRPERLPTPPNSSDIYFSLLTAPVYHNLRFSLQYLTWLQTIDPKQVHVITDKEDNEWIQAIKKEGGSVYTPKCPLSTRKSREMMCCKTGAQFDYFYRSREAGMDYKWYCHFDDDLYVNPQAVVNKLRSYDPDTDRYIGAWKCLAKIHKHNRIPAGMLAPNLLQFSERKRDDFQYANGPSYCISHALMAKVEKYLRGKKFEETCRRSDVVMDDVLPGVIIDGVLGIDMNVTDEFRSQLDPSISGSSEVLSRRAEKILSIGFRNFLITDPRFKHSEDIMGVLSYHCLLHPEVSWCQR